MTSNFSEAFGLFVGMLTGINQYTSAQITSEMLHQIKTLVHLPNIIGLFTRGASHQGKHMMKRFGFEAIKNSEISVLPITQERLKRHQVERTLAYR